MFWNFSGKNISLHQYKGILMKCDFTKTVFPTQRPFPQKMQQDLFSLYISAKNKVVLQRPIQNLENFKQENMLNNKETGYLLRRNPIQVKKWNK